MTLKDAPKQFITISHDIFEGERAAELLEKCNDKKYLTSDGIIKVDKERWDIAQQYERNIWMQKYTSAADDRNKIHEILFLGYDDLQRYHFKNVIEIGCGPFTNMRIILQHINRPQKIVLLDPLVSDYLKHPNCSYKNRFLNEAPIELIDSPAEEFIPSDQFDLVVMINVLDHCFDISKVFNTVIKCLKPSGIFVFSDSVFLPHDLWNLIPNNYDAGHPIRLTEAYVDNFLKDNFRILYLRKFFGLYNEPHRIDIYFIGEMKNPSYHEEP